MHTQKTCSKKCYCRSNDAGGKHMKRITCRKGNCALIIDETSLSFFFRKTIFEKCRSVGDWKWQNHSACHDCCYIRTFFYELFVQACSQSIWEDQSISHLIGGLELDFLKSRDKIFNSKSYNLKSIFKKVISKFVGVKCHFNFLFPKI